MRIAAKHIASTLFACAAFAPVGIWYILLFVAKPDHLSVSQAAFDQALYVFSAESPALWFFILLAALPIAFSLLAIASLRMPASAWRANGLVTLTAVAVSVLTVAVIWQAALFSGLATFLMFQQRAR